jgi:hypothetical protein
MALRWWLCRIEGIAMKRVNGHRFYELAVKVHPLTELKPDGELKEHFFALYEARDAILDLFQAMPLRICHAPALKITGAIDSILPRDWKEAIKSIESEDKLGYVTYTISEAAREFETVLAAEVPNLDTYLVSQKGTHSTPDLIERAEIMFPESIRKRLPAVAINDIRHAGRCLALDNPTASVFHVLRAVESVMAEYFNLVTGKPMPTRMRNWGIYLKSLAKHPDSSPKVVAFLDHLRDNYRNPILHPDVLVSEDEAEAFLGAAISGIRMLVLEIQSLEKARSLTVIMPAPALPAPSLSALAAANIQATK